MSAPASLTDFDLPLEQLERYRPERDEPGDFDAFWAATLADAERHPLDVALTPVEPRLTAVEAFDVVFRGFGGDPVGGWLVRPRDAAEPRPCVVEFLGYHAGRGSVYDHLGWASAGYVNLVVETRGQGGPWQAGATRDPHTADPHLPGRMTNGIRSPQTYVYRRIFADAARAVGAAAAQPQVDPARIAVAGRNEQAVAEAARRYGFAEHATDWRALIADERVELFDNSGPNDMHAEPTIAAAEAGKHVICEKPLGRDAGEAHETWKRVEAAGVKHMCAFNYRFVPAVRLARQLIEAGELGEIRHFRGSYLQEWGDDPNLTAWRFDRAAAGSGALGDLGAHVIDLARYLVGEIAAVQAATATFIPERDGTTVDVDDAVTSLVAFEHGAVGTIEASRFCRGRKNAFTWEINGSKGSIRFDLERLNELQVHLTGSQPGSHAQGFRTVLVSEADHPFWEHWWPHGHVIGWEHTFVHELHHLLTAIRDDVDVAPHGATLEDGYRAAEVCDAMLRSAEQGTREAVAYRG